MTNAPWYLNNDRPTLKHQKDWREKLEDSKQWYDRGAKVFQATKWRKGACENCGAMSHKTKDCLERPRAKGAKYTNKNIAADEKVEDIQLGSFDAKRDRWNGYDAKDYVKVMERFDAIEHMRNEIKKKEQVEKAYKGDKQDGKDDEAEENGADEDQFKIEDDEDAGFGEVKKRVRTTAGGASGSVRNLRIREDTAKYLLNLDLNSAHYDPKSRSMREDPLPHRNDADKGFAGDNFVRKSGDYQAWEEQTMHALTAFDKGQDIHMQAAPSMAELLHKQYKQKKELLNKQTKQEVLEKYGSATEAAPEDVAALQQTERYVEYDRMGRVVKGQEVKARSQYEEDVLINNHTAVWGSWWHDGAWGYACCHSMVKNSYCTGKVGVKAAEQTEEQMLRNMEARAKAEEEMQKKRENSKLNGYKKAADVWGEAPDGDVELDEKKLKEAMKKLDREEREVETDERKRKFNSLKGGDEGITPEEMEAYRLKKSRGGEDPLAKIEAAKVGGYDFV